MGGGGFSGIDYLHSDRDDLFDERAQEWVVRAAEDECVGIQVGGGGVLEEIVEIDADDLLGYGVIWRFSSPAFFY